MVAASASPTSTGRRSRRSWRERAIMAYSDFGFPDVLPTLGLDYQEADLFASVPPMPLRADFAETLREGVALALLVYTEKARSEFIIAPLLLELRRALHATFGLFS